MLISGAQDTPRIVIGVIWVFIAAVYFLRAFSYEASLKRGTDLIDERSEMLRCKAKAMVYDIFTRELIIGVACAVILLYLIAGDDIDTDAVIYILTGICFSNIVLTVTELVVLQKLDKNT